MTLGEIISEYRKRHNLSMDDFASASGISKSYISVLENNSRPGTNSPVMPTIETVYKAAKAMDVDEGGLFSNLVSEMKEESRIKDKKIERIMNQLPCEDLIKWIGFGEGLLHSQQAQREE